MPVPLTSALEDAQARAPSQTPDGREPFVTVLSVVLLVDFIIAAVLSLSVDTGSDFAGNVVYAQCIGVSILVLTRLATRVLERLARRGTNPRPRFAGILFITTPLGFVIGGQAASSVLGHPSLALADGIRESGFGIVVLLTICASVVIALHFRARARVAALQLQAAVLQSEAATQRANAAAERERAQTVSRLATETQLRLIQAQLEPHMLFNTLANLHALMATDPPRARLMVDRLISWLRSTLAATRHDRATLASEFELLRDYLELVSIRFGTRLGYALDLPPELRDEPVLPMLLQPLVENAVRHGIEPAIGGGFITVSVSARIGRLHIVVHDTGVGIRKMCGSGSGDGGGFGLAQIRERLRNQWGTKARMWVYSPWPAGKDDDARSGTRVDLLLPRITEGPST